jgi:hypothetical protein
MIVLGGLYTFIFLVCHFFFLFFIVCSWPVMIVDTQFFFFLRSWCAVRTAVRMAFGTR